MPHARTDDLQRRPRPREFVDHGSFCCRCGAALWRPALSYPAATVAAVTDLTSFGRPTGPARRDPGRHGKSPPWPARARCGSPDVLTAGDPAAALAGRWLLRHPTGTRAVYRTDLAEWFDFGRPGGVAPRSAPLDHADAYDCSFGEAPRRRARPLAPAAVQRKLSAVPSCCGLGASGELIGRAPVAHAVPGTSVELVHAVEAVSGTGPGVVTGFTDGHPMPGTCPWRGIADFGSSHNARRNEGSSKSSRQDMLEHLKVFPDACG